MAWHDDEDATTGCDSWLVTPQISVPATGGQLRFYQAVGFGTYYTYHGVQVTTDADPDPAVATYTELWSGNGTGSWTEQTIDLGAYAGQDVYLAFNYVGDWSSEWYVDDVSVDEEVCPTVNYDSGAGPDQLRGPAAQGRGLYAGAIPKALRMASCRLRAGSVDNVARSSAGIIVDAATYPDWVHSGDYAALAYWDGNEDIWLYSPSFTVDPGDSDLTFWAYSATLFQGTPVDGQEVDLYAIDENGVETAVWDLQADEVWDDSAWREVTVSLAPWAGENVQLAWHYYRRRVDRLQEPLCPGRRRHARRDGCRSLSPAPPSS